jgi:peptide/nickel transport system substrate-binding protein
MKLIFRFLLKIRKIILEKNLKDLIALFGLFIGFFLIFLYFQQTSSQKPAYGGIYREALYEQINSLNPLSPQNSSEEAILNIIYPPLIEFDNGKVISKYLKNYYFSPDKLTLTVELKDNLFWSDGDKISTDDLKFSFEAYKKYSSPEIFNFFKNAEFEVIDPQKGEFKLTFNDNYFFYRLNYLRILPSKIFASALITEEFNLENLKIGGGPFVFESLIKKEKMSILTLIRNNYYQPKPYLDKVIFHIYSSPKKAFDSLILKEVDGLAGLNYFQLPSNLFLNYKIHKITLPRVVGLFFNGEQIDEHKVKFLNQKINRQDLITKVFNGFAEESYGIFSPTIRKVFQLPELPQSSQEITKKTPTTTLVVPASYFYPEIARYLKERLKSEFIFVDPKDVPQIIKNKDFQGILFGLEYSHPPEIASFFSTLGYNINNISNLSLEKKFQSLISDPQIKIVEELTNIEKEIININKNVFLLNPYYLYFLNKKNKGFDQFYLTRPESRFVKIEFWYKTK